MEDVLHDLNIVERDGAELNLHLNYQKSEVICVDKDTRDVVLSILPGARVVPSWANWGYVFHFHHPEGEHQAIGDFGRRFKHF